MNRSEAIMQRGKRREDFAYVKNPRDFFSVNVPILFFDVVGFTKDTTNEAMRRCIRNIEDSMRDILYEDYNWNERNKSNHLILVPTGDGYAIAFDGDMSLNKVFDLSATLYKRIISNSDNFKLRFGMAKGPCMVHQDLNEKNNIFGYGINMASRVMGIALDNQFLVHEELASELLRAQDYPRLHKIDKPFPIKHGESIMVYNFYEEGPNGFGNEHEPE